MKGNGWRLGYITPGYRIKYLPTLIVLLLLICSCCYADTNTDTDQGWPQYVSDSMWLPLSAEDVKHSVVRGEFQTYYRADICYPAKSLIDDMARFMKSRGWSRSEYDLFNPRNKLPSFLAGGIAWRGYPWWDYWKDTAGNVVFYQYDYDVGAPSSLYSFETAVQKPCSLRGLVVYYPSDVFLEVKSSLPGGR
jgi:hypothetical protein